MNKTTRKIPPSNAKPTGERNKRREGLVKGASTAQGIFSLSVTECHATHLPLPMGNSSRYSSKPHRRKGKFQRIGYCDYRPGDRVVPDRVRWGSHPRQGALRPTLASALHGRGLPKPKKGENSSGGADVSAAKAIKPNVAEEALRSLTRDGQSASTVEEIAVPPRHLARSLRQSAAGTEQVSVR